MLRRPQLFAKQTAASRKLDLERYDATLVAKSVQTTYTSLIAHCMEYGLLTVRFFCMGLCSDATASAAAGAVGKGPSPKAELVNPEANAHFLDAILSSAKPGVIPLGCLAPYTSARAVACHSKSTILFLLRVDSL